MRKLNPNIEHILANTVMLFIVVWHHCVCNRAVSWCPCSWNSGYSVHLNRPKSTEFHGEKKKATLNTVYSNIHTPVFHFYKTHTASIYLFWQAAKWEEVITLVRKSLSKSTCSCIRKYMVWLFYWWCAELMNSRHTPKLSNNEEV